MFISTPPYLPAARIQLDNVEFAQMGQAFQVDRYPIFFGQQGDVNFKSWVRGCSIHHSYNRAVGVHATQRLAIQSNTAFNVMGHAFFLKAGFQGLIMLRLCTMGSLDC